MKTDFEIYQIMKEVKKLCNLEKSQEETLRAAVKSFVGEAYKLGERDGFANARKMYRTEINSLRRTCEKEQERLIAKTEKKKKLSVQKEINGKDDRVLYDEIKMIDGQILLLSEIIDVLKQIG